LSSTRHLLTTSNLTVQLHHVKGHQDSKHFGPHTRDASLNIEADGLAKKKLEDYKPGPKNFHIPWSQGVCYTGHHRTVKEFATTIRDHINGQATIAYWIKRRQLSQGIWNTFDWASIGRAMKEIPINRRRWVSKYVSGHFATGENMQRWKFRTSAQCPRCQETTEDKTHIMTCPDPNARETWKKSLRAIEMWLKDEQTDKTIREQLLVHLTNWNTTNTPPTNHDSTNDPSAESGKQYIWDGWLQREWRDRQDQIWKQMRSRKSSKRWTSELIKKLWNVAWDMWDQRNEALHESSLNREQILEKDTNDQIKQIYAVGIGQLARTDFALMKNPIEHQLQLPLQTKRQWVASIEAALQRKQLHEHGTMLAEQRLMAAWVIRNPPRRTPAPVAQRRTNNRLARTRAQTQ